MSLEQETLFFLFNWDSLHTRLKQPQRGRELQGKEAQKG